MTVHCLGSGSAAAACRAYARAWEPCSWIERQCIPQCRHDTLCIRYSVYPIKKVSMQCRLKSETQNMASFIV